jgi:hypothetical protein
MKEVVKMSYIKFLRNLDLKNSTRLSDNTVIIPLICTPENEGELLTCYCDIQEQTDDYMIFEEDKDIPIYFGKVFLIIEQGEDGGYKFSFGAFIANCNILYDDEAYSFEIMDVELTKAV